ncbi:hypothetical protein DNC80_07375 [Flavobacterium sp. SOK18b]|nr:hypothetical protein [Flavobacterium sp. SOK18b]
MFLKISFKYESLIRFWYKNCYFLYIFVPIGCGNFENALFFVFPREIYFFEKLKYSGYHFTKKMIE